MPFFDTQTQFLPEEVLEYLRKSRDDDPNATVEETLSKHEEILKNWVDRNLSGPIPNENIYREVVSGETLDGRPEVLKLLQRINSPKIKAILIVEPQRLSRGDLEDCGRLIKLLRYTHTKVITPTKIYDLEDDFDRESFERELKRGNEYLEYYKKIQARGKMLSISDGCFIANRAPYGYKKLVLKEGKRDIHTLEIDEEKAKIVRLIFDWHVNQNMGLGIIANKLNEMKIPSPTGNIWTYNGLRDLVGNEHYVGKIRWNYNKSQHVVVDGEIKLVRLKKKDYLLFDGRHEAIIDEETFYKGFSQRKPGKPRTKESFETKNPLAGMMFCAKCGRAVVLKPAGSKGELPRYMCGKQHICGNGSTIADEVLAQVSDTLRKAIADFRAELDATDDAIIRRQEMTISIMEQRLRELEQKEISLWDKYSEESMPKAIFDKLNAKVLADKEEVIRSLNEARANTINTDVYVERITTFHAAVTALNNDAVSATETNKLLQSCIKRIAFSREKSTRLKKTSDVTNNLGWVDYPIQLDIELNI